VALATLDLLDPAAYDIALGVSVGSVNVPEWAAGRMEDLHDLYEEVDGLSWYLRPRMPWEWLRASGVYSTSRLEHRMRVHGTDPGQWHCRVGVGVFDLGAEEYVTISDFGTHDLHRARAASSAIPLLCAPVDLGGRLYGDGGWQHVIPDLPDAHLYDEIDVILCSPIDRTTDRPQGRVNGWGETAALMLDRMIDNVVQADLERLRGYARAGARVRLFAPRWAGSALDASRDTMRRRRQEGRWMARNPTTL